MGRIAQLKNSNGEKLYPITKTQAVYNDAGFTVEQLLENEIEDRSSSITVLQSRIDSLSTLEEGSTTGDAELIDLRIGIDGNRYESAGSAVRTQISELYVSGRDVSQLVDIINSKKIDDAYVEDGYLFMTSNGEVVAGPLGPFSGGGGGGGGGGSDNNAEMTAENTTGWLTKTISYGTSCPISFTWSSTENDIQTGPGSLTVFVNGTQKINITIQQGSYQFDAGQYLASGSNTVRVKITDSYSNVRYLNFSITAVLLSVSSSFDVSAPFSGEILFAYTPIGALTKISHFILDGEEIGTQEVTVSGRQVTFAIPAQSHGSHTLRYYFEAEIDGGTVLSNELYYNFMCIEEGNNTPIITTSFTTTRVNQYVTLPIKYRVYNPTSYSSAITITVNGVEVTALTVDRTEQTYSYHATEPGEIIFKIITGNVSRELVFTVDSLNIDVEAETRSLSLYLSSYGRSNNEAAPQTWEYNDISAQFSNFNMTSDCWQIDNEGITVMRVTGDARLSIPYKPFATDFRSTGKTIEIEFETHDVLNYDADIVTCMNGGRGFSLTAQKALLKSEQSEIYTQYKENEHVRIAFVIEKQSENRLLYIYINGMLSGVVQYGENDDFAQSVPQNIQIGSNDCTIDLYTIRVYDNNLTRFQILDNWIADTQNGELLYERYTRNNVFDDYGNIVIEKLPPDLPYMIIRAPELPQSKGDKKNIDGTFVNPNDPTRSFEFTGAQADVQGTSSQYYPRKNYKIKFKGGFVVNGSTSKNYAMNEDAIATNTFTFKADFASSEGANNVELVRLYNSANPYKTEYQLSNPKIRQGIDGFPMVIFYNNGTSTEFIGKYNFNNDKGTPEVFGFLDGDESWEILNNTGDRVVWKNDIYGVEYEDGEGVVHPADEWLNDFEGRFPEDNTDYTNLAQLASWLRSTDMEQATDEALSESVTYEGVTYTTDSVEYRLAKFKAEASDHLEMSAIEFYYLFTELFLMVDSRAKNAFPTFMAGSNWFSLPYDFDTAIGINNEGELTFHYSLEDIDKTESGADVYNGQNSVLWINLREAYFDELAQMYRDLRSSGALSYSRIEQMFEDHQSKWPEAIFNEDSYFKYIKPFVDSNTDYLEMLQGSKTEQRKWWLYNRFRYIDSKYNAGDSLTDVITVRGYAKSNITVTPYADIYPTVKYGSYLVQERGTRNTPTTLVCPLSNVNDTEIYIYSASQLASIGDLSGLKPGLVDISMASRLQELKVGDADPNYSNANFKTMTLGNNVLLKKIDARNCTALSTEVNMSGCKNIEEIYFDGTSVTALTLPNGGIIKKLHLPGTVTNLTILNQTAITEFVLPSYENLTTVRLENVSPVVDPITILYSVPVGSRIRIIGFNIELESVQDIDDFCDYLNSMRGLDENGQNMDVAQVQGGIHVPQITGAILGEYAQSYPNITITYDHITSKIYYYTYDGSELLYTETVEDEGNGIWNGSPSRTETAQYYFTFAGWSRETDSTPQASAVSRIILERTVYAAYARTLRAYTVTWVNIDGSILEIDENVYYGTVPTYNGELPSYGGRYSNGWDKEIEAVTGDVTYTAVYLPVYTVWFYNGSILLQTSQVVQGSSVEYTGETPIDPDGEGAEWLGWSRVYGTHTPDQNALKNIIQNTYIYAVYRANYEYPTSTNVSGAYGIEWAYGRSSLELVRTGLAASFVDPIPAETDIDYGASPFDTVMPWSGIKRYNIINGEVAYDDTSPDFNEELYDTVVYIPTFYYTAIKDVINGKWIWAISPTPKDGYCIHPGSNKYVGRFHSVGDSTALYSRAGDLPLTSTNLNDFRTYSQAKGYGWDVMDQAVWSAIQLLYLVEFADFDSQKTLGTGFAGVLSSVGETGETGQAIYHTLKKSQAHNMYRWIEDPFSNCRDWVDGFFGNRGVTYAAARDGYTGDITGLNSLGFGLPATGYMSGFGYSEAAAWAFIPDESYSVSTPDVTIDYISSSPARCALFVGGDYDAYESYGLFMFYASCSPNVEFKYLGSRLIYRP